MAKKARKISDMRQLDMIRKHSDRLIKGSHTVEQVSNFIDQDVPNSDQALRIKHEIYLAHAEHLDHILNKIKAINAGKEKMSFSASSNELITVYPHAKVIKKHPLKLEVEYKPYKSYFIADPELYERYLEVQELKEMQEFYSSEDINKKEMQEQRAQVKEYWKKLNEQGYTFEEIGSLFNASANIIRSAIMLLKKDKIVWKYFN